MQWGQPTVPPLLSSPLLFPPLHPSVRFIPPPPPRCLYCATSSCSFGPSFAYLLSPSPPSSLTLGGTYLWITNDNGLCSLKWEFCNQPRCVAQPLMALISSDLNAPPRHQQRCESTQIKTGNKRAVHPGAVRQRRSRLLEATSANNAALLAYFLICVTHRSDDANITFSWKAVVVSAHIQCRGSSREWESSGGVRVASQACKRSTSWSSLHLFGSIFTPAEERTRE